MVRRVHGWRQVVHWSYSSSLLMNVHTSHASGTMQRPKETCRWQWRDRSQQSQEQHCTQDVSGTHVEKSGEIGFTPEFVAQNPFEEPKGSAGSAWVCVAYVRDNASWTNKTRIVIDDILYLTSMHSRMKTSQVPIIEVHLWGVVSIQCRGTILIVSKQCYTMDDHALRTRNRCANTYEPVFLVLLEDARTQGSLKHSRSFLISTPQSSMLHHSRSVTVIRIVRSL